MQEENRKFSKEIKDKLLGILSSKEIVDIIKGIKQASDSGTFEVIISTENVDRHGESVSQAGWDLSFFMNNPVVLWSHDYYSPPIGVADEVKVVNGQLVAKGRFAPEEANPFAQQVRRLYDAGMIRATSVGFIAHEMEGTKITKAELLEFSFVAVPANPFALSLDKIKELNIDVGMLKTKGLAVKLNKDEKGDVANELSREEVERQKWAKVNGLFDVFDAFLSVYMDEETPLEDFDKLVLEMADLMTGKASQSSLSKLSTGQLSNLYAKHLIGNKQGKKKDAQQIGAILAEMQTVIDDAVIRAAQIILNIIQTEYGQSAVGKAEIMSVLKGSQFFGAIKKWVADFGYKLEDGEEGNPPDGRAPKQRSQVEGDVAQPEVDDFLAARNILKTFVTAASVALSNLNKRERDMRKTRSK